MKLCTCFSALLNSSFRGHHGHQQGCAADPLRAQLGCYDTGALGLRGQPRATNSLSLLEPSPTDTAGRHHPLVDKQANPLGRKPRSQRFQRWSCDQITHLSAAPGHGVYTFTMSCFVKGCDWRRGEKGWCWVTGRPHAPAGPLPPTFQLAIRSPGVFFPLPPHPYRHCPAPGHIFSSWTISGLPFTPS